MLMSDTPTTVETATRKPRLGFVGLGWIGRHRMEAIAASGHAEIVALSDPAPEAVEASAALSPGAARCASLDEVLAERPDGVVIATPSAMHADQTIRALEAGAAVFCQKPLGRTRDEAEAAVAAARRADRLLHVDLSYRHTAALRAIRTALDAGALGEVFAVDLTFHNAYGPDKPWFFDVTQSGGGCVMDLGVHLVDMALWALDFPEVADVSAHLYAGGRPLEDAEAQVEDFAVVTLTLATGAVVRLTCSWNLPAGRDAVIGADFYGTGGGASFANVDGSFFNFTAHLHEGTASRAVAVPPDDWGGRAAAAWAERLARDPRFDPSAENLVRLSGVLDRVYAGLR